MAKRKRLTMDEIAANMKEVLTGNGVNIDGNQKTFDNAIKKAVKTTKQPVSKRPQT